MLAGGSHGADRALGQEEFGPRLRRVSWVLVSELFVVPGSPTFYPAGPEPAETHRPPYAFTPEIGKVFPQRRMNSVE